MKPTLAAHSEKLIYFYEAGRVGTLHAAARNLGLAVPTVSQSVAKLEAVVGVSLFHRSKRGLQLTPAGHDLMAFCRRFFRDLEDIQRAVVDGTKTHSFIRVGTFPSIALYFWPLLLEVLDVAVRPSMSISTDRSKDVLERLIKRDLDVAITVEAAGYKRLVTHEIFSDSYAFYSAAGKRSLRMTSAACKEAVLIYMPDASDISGRSLRESVARARLAFRSEIETDSFDVVATFVARGIGVGILPTKVAESHRKTLQMVHVEGLSAATFGRHRIHLSYRDDLELPAQMIRVLLAAAKRAARRL